MEERAAAAAVLVGQAGRQASRGAAVARLGRQLGRHRLARGGGPLAPGAGAGLAVGNMRGVGLSGLEAARARFTELGRVSEMKIGRGLKYKIRISRITISRPRSASNILLLKDIRS